MYRKLLLGFLVIGMLFPHTLWINSTGHYGKIGEHTIVFLGWGHRFPVADFISRDEVKGYGVALPSGKMLSLEPQGKVYESVLNFTEDGYYHVFAFTKAGFYTMSLHKGSIYHYQKPMDRVKGKILVSNCYQEFARALIKVGEGNYNDLSRVLGLKMEIIPLMDPSTLKIGDFLKVRVLYNGKPLPFVPIHATYEGFSTGDDYAFATETDSRGVARIRIIHWGKWMVKAHLKKPADGKLSGKCRMISVVSTLTLEIR